MVLDYSLAYKDLPRQPMQADMHQLLFLSLLLLFFGTSFVSNILTKILSSTLFYFFFFFFNEKCAHSVTSCLSLAKFVMNIKRHR